MYLGRVQKSGQRVRSWLINSTNSEPMGHPECLDGALPYPVGWMLRARLGGRSALPEGVAKHPAATAAERMELGQTCGGPVQAEMVTRSTRVSTRKNRLCHRD